MKQIMTSQTIGATSSLESLNMSINELLQYLEKLNESNETFLVHIDEEIFEECNNLTYRFYINTNMYYLLHIIKQGIKIKNVNVEVLKFHYDKSMFVKIGKADKNLQGKIHCDEKGIIIEEGHNKHENEIEENNKEKFKEINS